ncbi:hypothetical protein BVRB_6g156410 [Beta vulgaris subsp. vulgaris]|uniref:Uncharacterized protein n=1 Tax=Beta vulgaris subsp. vulgaris TaxID=3555 RepID=A0A0J8E2G7_BETVV|nr:hypothetical protein BVRB_6g156410 [Beta vulgaris subsp. vulgaris]
MPRGLLKAEIRPGGGDFRPSDGDQLWLVHVAAASGLFT